MINLMNIYKDKKNTLLIVPTAADENGVLRELNYPIIIEMPYDAETIGKKIKDGFDICIKTPFQSARSAVKVYQILLGYNSWAKFYKERNLIWGEFDLKIGYTFTPCKKSSQALYAPFGEQIYIHKDLYADNKTIGEAVINAFDYIMQNS